MNNSHKNNTSKALQESLLRQFLSFVLVVALLD